MDKDLLHLIILLVSVLAALLVGKEWGKAKAWISAHAQIVEAAIKAEEAKADAFWSGEIAKAHAAYEVLKETMEAKIKAAVDAVEARAAADLAQVKAEADAAIQKVKNDAAVSVAQAIVTVVNPSTPAAPVVAENPSVPTA
jgi:4-aminobutyrate aminotransferase-like enzyme